MTNREREILDIIRDNPQISQNEIAQKLNITRSSVGVHIAHLIDKGYIIGRGYIVSDSDYISIVGGSDVDIIGKPFNALIAQDSNPGNISYSVGGVGRNIAENLAKLDVDTRLLTAIGNDANGDLIKENARINNIDISHSLVLDDYKTATYLAILDESHDLSVAIADMSINEAITPDVINKNLNFLNRGKICIIDTNLDLETIEYIAENTQNDLFVDTVSVTKAKKILNILPRIHTIKPNRFEAELLSGIKIESTEDILRAGREIVRRGVKRVFLTLGEDGAYFFEGDEVLRIISNPIEVENATGAGDAFMAGLAYSHYVGLPIEESIYIAVGASRVTLKDNNTISSELNIENIERERGEIEIC